MGYHMEQEDCAFFMEAADAPKAAQAMRDLDLEGKEYLPTDSLGDILDKWSWELDIAESGNVRDIQFMGEKSRNELTMFNVIAPFVKAGSYIEMLGEDGTRWRYVFDGAICKEVYARISWE